MADEEAPFVDAGRDSDVEESNQHFIRGLIAPAHNLAGVWIVRIVGRIIKPADGLERGSRFKGAGFGEFVA